MSNPCPVIMCDEDAGDGIICRQCLHQLEKTLAEVPWLLDELDTAIKKESRFAASDKITRKGNHQPLPFDVSASDARAELTARLTLWASDVAHRQSVTTGAALSPTWAAAWLVRNIEHVRTFVAAEDLVEELSAARATAVYVIDRPMERRYLGECGYQHTDEDGTTYEPCGATLWGRDGDDEVTCKVCGTMHSAAILEQKIQREAANGLEDRIYTATEAAEVIVALRLSGQDNAPKLVDRIRKWAEQPRDQDKRPRLTRKIDLMKHGHKRPGYRLGDIIQLVNETASTGQKTRRSA